MAMNVRPDMLRQQGIPHLQQQMLNMNSQHFLQQQQQQQQQPGQQNGVQPPPHMPMLSTNPNAQPMALLNGQPSNGAPGIDQQRLLQLQLSQRRQTLVMQQSQAAQGLSQPPAGPSHVNGISHNQLGMGFPNPMMQSQPIRRAQPPLNQPNGHIAGMHTGQAPVGSMGNMGAIGMNGSNNMPAQLRQAVQQRQQHDMQMRMQQQQQQHQQQPGLQQGHQGHMSPDMSMALSRQPHLVSNSTMLPHARTASAQAQMMGPALSQAHPGGLQQQPMHPNAFQSTMSLQHQQQHQHPPPQMNASPHNGPLSQNHAPVNMGVGIPTSGAVPSQGLPARARLTPDNGMLYQNSQMAANIAHGQRHPSSGGGSYPFVPSSSTPPNQDQLGNISQGMAGPLNPPGSSRPGLMPTPAQAFEMSQTADAYQPPFMHPSQVNAPARPPSQHGPHNGYSMQQPQHHQSPHQADHLSMAQAQRPQSQPQAPGQSPQQAGRARTPRVPQPQPPMNPGMAPGRTPIVPGQPLPLPSQPSAQPTNSSMPGHSIQMTPRHQPPAMAAANGPPHPPGSAAPQLGGLPQQGGQDGTVPPPMPPMPPVPSARTHIQPIGNGQGVSRLLQFGAMLASSSESKLTLKYWQDVIHEYFFPGAMMKYTLWKDNLRNEAKPFEITVPILPRFFLVTSQSGVKSMHLSLDGARERTEGPTHSIIECPSAVWTYKYSNGYQVVLRGPLTAHILVEKAPPNGPNQVPWKLKFDNFQFDANIHEKYVALDSIIGNRMEESPKTPRLRAPPTPNMNGAGPSRAADEDRRSDEPRIIMERASMPAEPVNAFGIPQATMRCLELAESVMQMSDLIKYSNEHRLGPLESLAQFAKSLRENRAQSGAPPSGNHPGSGGSGGGIFDNVNGVPAAASHSLYTSPVVLPHPHPPPPTPTAPPQNGPAPLEGPPPKQNKAPQPQASGSTPAATTPAAAATPSTGPNTTPSISNATLKRKAPQSDASPSTNADQAPAAKRTSRKRGRTQGGG